jgi:hypothetical protein
VVCALVRNGQAAVFSNYCIPQQDFTWEAKQLPTQPTQRPETNNIISNAFQCLIRHSGGEGLFLLFSYSNTLKTLTKSGKKIKTSNALQENELRTRKINGT